MIIELRPWGKFEILADGPGYKVKLITVDPGKRTSLQSHCDRSEHLFVMSGTAAIESQTLQCHGIKGPKDILHPQSAFINPFEIHRIGNRHKEPAVILELSLASEEGGRVLEDDITRYEDDFGRPTEALKESNDGNGQD